MSHGGSARQGGFQSIVGTIEVAQQPLYVHLTDDGTEATGEPNAIGVYSTTSGPDTYFWHAAGADREEHFYRLMIHIQDSTGMASKDYGNITNGLANGIRLVVLDSDGTDHGPVGATILTEITAHVDTPVKTNAEWGKWCFDVNYENQGSGDDYLNVRWTFRNSGTEIRLRPGQMIAVILHDDFSGLIKHNFVLQGHYG